MEKWFDDGAQRKKVPDEKIKLWIRKTLYALLIVLFIVSPAIYTAIQSAKEPAELPELLLTDESVCVDDYYDALDESYCTVTLTFNQNVTPGYVRISFYNEEGYFIETQKLYLTADVTALDSEVVSTTCFVNGYVDSYEILTYDFEAAPMQESDDDIFYALYTSGWLCLALFSPVWIRIFTESCKEYIYNGQSLLVYCGHFHYYIKVNGTKYDEVFKLFPVFSFTLSCRLDSGDEAFVRITPAMKRIRLKINDRLYQPE